MIKWIKNTWHATRAQTLKKRMRALDPTDEQGRDKLRAKKLRHLDRLDNE